MHPFFLLPRLAKYVSRRGFIPLLNNTTRATMENIIPVVDNRGVDPERCSVDLSDAILIGAKNLLGSLRRHTDAPCHLCRRMFWDAAPDV